MASELQRIDNVVINQHLVKIKQRKVDSGQLLSGAQRLPNKCTSTTGYRNVDPEHEHLLDTPPRYICYECGALVLAVLQ